MTFREITYIERELTLSGTLSEENRLKFTKDLEVAYGSLRSLHLINEGQITKELALTLAKVTYLFARCTFGSKMEESRRLFKLSTALQLAGMGLIDSTALPSLASCENLESLSTFLKEKEPVFKDVDDFVMGKTNDEIFESVQGNEGAYSLALAFRWMLGAEQNLETNQTNEHIGRFEKIYSVSRRILEGINTSESKWESALIIYNGERFVQSLKKDVDGAFRVLEQLKPYIENENGSTRSQILEAQIDNMKNVLIGEKLKKASPETKLSLLKEQYFYVYEASIKASRIETFDPFLKTLFFSNRIKVALDCEKEGEIKASQEELNLWAEMVMAYLEKENYFHTYSPQFLLVIAELRISQKDFFTAKICLKEALKLIEKAPSNLKYSEVKNSLLKMLATIDI